MSHAGWAVVIATPKDTDPCEKLADALQFYRTDELNPDLIALLQTDPTLGSGHS